MNDFPGHKGRPGQKGGSLPRGGSGGGSSEGSSEAKKKDKFWDMGPDMRGHAVYTSGNKNKYEITDAVKETIENMTKVNNFSHIELPKECAFGTAKKGWPLSHGDFVTAYYLSGPEEVKMINEAMTRKIASGIKQKGKRGELYKAISQTAEKALASVKSIDSDGKEVYVTGTKSDGTEEKYRCDMGFKWVETKLNINRNKEKQQFDVSVDFDKGYAPPRITFVKE